MLLTHLVVGQTFTDAYEAYRLDRIDKLSNRKARKQLQRFIKSQKLELYTVFESYKSKGNFDFNTADTLFLIYDSPVESPFTSHIIIWSGKDTISYRQGFEMVEPFTNKRTITYEPFIPSISRPKGLKVVTERDSLVQLVSKRDFATINHLGDQQSISDGGIISIFVAYKNNGQYKFETCFPKQFIIRDVYRIE